MSVFLEKRKFFTVCTGIVWGVSGLVFLPYITDFTLGNHDFRFVRFGMELEAGVWEGRFTQFFMPWILLGGQLLPVLNVFLGFLFLAAAVVLLAQWYGLGEKYLPVLLFSALIVLNPYILSQLYYAHTILSVLCWHFCAICGVVLVSATDDAGRRRIFKNVIGVMLMLLALCGYAPVLELLLSVFLGKIFIEAGRLQESFFCVLKRYLPVAVGVLAAVFLYALLLEIFKRTGAVNSGMYNVQALPAAAVGQKIFSEWAKPWEILLTPLPYCSLLTVWLLCVLVLSAVMSAVGRRLVFLRLLCLLFFGYALFAAAFLSGRDIFATYRIHAQSVPYFGAVMLAAVLVLKRKVWRNISLATAVILIFLFVRADLEAQKVWLLGNRQDDFEAERIRADVAEKLVLNRKYRLTVLGGLYGRSKFAQKPFYSEEKAEPTREYYGYPRFLNVFFSSGLFLYEAENPILGDGIFLGETVFYGTNNEYLTSKQRDEAQDFCADFKTDDVRAVREALDVMQPFPQSGYFYVGKKDIILYLSEDIYRKSLLKSKFK